MPERSNGMIQEHAGTGPAHHLPDPGPHVRVVAMYRTFTACGLYFGRSETAMFQTVNGAPQPSFLLQYGLFCVLTYKSTPIGFLTAAKVRNKRDFYQLMSNESKVLSRRFCSQKEKTGCIIGRLRQIGWSVWRSHFFSSLILTLL